MSATKEPEKNSTSGSTPATQETLPDEEKVFTKLVYAGVRIFNDSKAYLFYRLTPVDEELHCDYQETRCAQAGFWLKVKDVGRPGGVYEVRVKSAAEPGTIYPSTLKYVRWWGDEEAVLYWQTMHDAAMIEDDLRRKKDRETKRNRFFEALEPIRNAYHNAPSTQRRIILAQVVEAVTRSTSLKS